MSSHGGFSIVELLVVGTLSAAIVGGLLAILHSEAGAARQQALAAELQQSIRIARHELARACRAAGRGGLPAELAVEVRNNVALGERVGRPGTPMVASGSDILVVRGVFEGELVSVETAVETDGTGSLTLNRPLLAATDGSGDGRPLLLTGVPGSRRCRIVELLRQTTEGSEASETPRLTVLEYRSDGSSLAESYGALASLCRSLSADRIRRVGVLEELRYYLRRGGAVPGRSPSHRLARARFLPGSDRPWPGSSSGGAVLVDHALDLQVALGADRNGDGILSEATGSARALDEWHLNEPGDLPFALPPRVVRINLLMRAARPTRGRSAPPLDRLEDRLYGEPAAASAETGSRLFQRRMTTALVRIGG